MDDKQPVPQRNDALQSGPDDLAFGQDERDFGAGGQDAVSTGARELRDVDRDPKLDEAGESAARRAS
jgi:hypothetical protein